MTASVEMKETTDRESQGACRQDELIGGKQPVVSDSDDQTSFESESAIEVAASGGQTRLGHEKL
jgi:hypothetical protein